MKTKLRLSLNEACNIKWEFLKDGIWEILDWEILDASFDIQNRSILDCQEVELAIKFYQFFFLVHEGIVVGLKNAGMTESFKRRSPGPICEITVTKK